MRVFVTGASGFVGSAIVKELLKAGHQVLGLARTASSAERLISHGAQAHHGNLADLSSLKNGASLCDAVVHTAFNHDFTRFKANCEADRQVILALGATLAGSDRPLVITSGVGLLNKGRLVVETDKPDGADKTPRAASEEAANALSEQGVNVYTVRLPPTVHDEGDHGFIPIVIGLAKEKGESVYIEEGLNRWPAVHRLDAASVYHLIVEKQPAQKVYHAVAEEGIPFRQIATAIGQGLDLPIVSKDRKEVESHFGWFTHFASMNCPASSEQSRKTLGWEPKQIGLLDDLTLAGYF